MNHRCRYSKENFSIRDVLSQESKAKYTEILNEEMRIIIEIVESLEQFGLLIKSVSEIIKNEAIEQTFEFLSKLLDILGTSLLESVLAGKGVIKAGELVVQACERTVSAGIKELVTRYN